MPLFSVIPAALIRSPSANNSVNASSIDLVCLRYLIGGQPQSITPGSCVLSSTQAAQASPWHRAEKFSKSTQNVCLVQTGQSLHSRDANTVKPCSPMTSTSQTTTEAAVKSILSLFLRKLRSTFHAVSSLLKQPRDRPLPPSSTADGT